MAESDVSKVTNEMRLKGVRRENAFKNIGACMRISAVSNPRRVLSTAMSLILDHAGKKKFAFNKIQLSMIPEVYRAPKGSAEGATS